MDFKAILNNIHSTFIVVLMLFIMVSFFGSIDNIVSYSKDHFMKYDQETVAYVDTVISRGSYRQNKPIKVRCVLHYFDGTENRIYELADDNFILPKGFPIPVRYRHDKPNKVCINHLTGAPYNDTLCVFIKRDFWRGDIVTISKDKEYGR